jgi:translation initiation factor 1|tara:strand:+ start:7971 stop:8360 length:390 start_codon:yes stop_codon:yes gene_type:complete
MKNNNFKSGEKKDNPFSEALASAMGIEKNDYENQRDINDSKLINQEEVSLKGIVDIYFEKKGRAGKMVTLLDFSGIEGDGLIELSKKIKKSCGVGGSLKKYILLLQGDVRSNCEKMLNDLGLNTKRIGG